jgi:hypothetical protein
MSVLSVWVDHFVIHKLCFDIITSRKIKELKQGPRRNQEQNTTKAKSKSKQKTKTQNPKTQKHKP